MVAFCAFLFVSNYLVIRVEKVLRFDSNSGALQFNNSRTLNLTVRNFDSKREIIRFELWDSLNQSARQNDSNLGVKRYELQRLYDFLPQRTSRVARKGRFQGFRRAKTQNKNVLVFHSYLDFLCTALCTALVIPPMRQVSFFRVTDDSDISWFLYTYVINN